MGHANQDMELQGQNSVDDDGDLLMARRSGMIPSFGRSLETLLLANKVHYLFSITYST